MKHRDVSEPVHSNLVGDKADKAVANDYDIAVTPKDAARWLFPTWLSNSDELQLPLRWVAILYGRLMTDFAITTSIHTSDDVLKGLMSGAKVTMMASELLQNGLRRIKEILSEIETWMDEHEYISVARMIGSMSQQHCTEPAAFERANHMKTLDSFTPIY